MKKRFKGFGFYAILLIAIIIIYSMVSTGDEAEKYNFSYLVNAIKSEEVRELEIFENTAYATLVGGKKIEVDIPGYNALYEACDREIEQQIQAKALVISTPKPAETPWWLSLLPSLGMIILIFVFWFIFMNNAQGGGGRGVMSFGKTKAKMNIDENSKKTFEDVAGADEEKAELQEIVEFLKNPSKFQKLGARIPKGVLLVGPPGTGKTLLAKAVAGEAHVPFFSISGSDFVEMFVGVGASRVRDLFEQAKKNSPCIVFIDEIDAVGRQRGAGLGGGHDEREQTLNQLLVEMDGFGANDGVIIIAATNRPDILDRALLRPGRFDRQVLVDTPDVKGREAILKVHSKGKPFDESVKLDVLAKTTVGFTGADLENLTNEAALKAAKENRDTITMQDLEESIMKVIAGPEKKTRMVTEKEKRLTAVHEAGHAIVSKFLPTQDRVHQVSIIPRGRAGGYTLSLPKDDASYTSRTEMLEEIVVLLGGRIAESLMLGDISTGASNDIERATVIARNMIVKYGMSEKLGTRVFGDSNDEVFIGRDFGHTKDYSESVAAEIDAEIKAIIDECYKKCEDILKTNMNKLNQLSQLLLDKEKIDADEFEALFNPPTVESVDVKEVSETEETPKSVETEETIGE